MADDIEYAPVGLGNVRRLDHEFDRCWRLRLRVGEKEYSLSRRADVLIINQPGGHILYIEPMAANQIGIHSDQAQARIDG